VCWCDEFECRFGVFLFLLNVRTKRQVTKRSEIILSASDNAIEMMQQRVEKLRDELRFNPPRQNSLQQGTHIAFLLLCCVNVRFLTSFWVRWFSPSDSRLGGSDGYDNRLCLLCVVAHFIALLLFFRLVNGGPIKVRRHCACVV
jgi:hypothetical protein